MRRFAPYATAAVVAACMLGLLTAQDRSVGPVPTRYRVLTQGDLWELVPREASIEKRDGDSDYAPARRLARSLELLASDGWDLVAIEPYDERSGENGAVAWTVSKPTTYVFRLAR